MRKNKKTQLVDYENTIQKSNEFSMAKLNHGLTLNQMQLLAFAIYSTQKNGVTEFYKAEFEKKFGIEKYQTKHARDDSERLLNLKISIEDLENKKFKFWNVFMGMEYDNGLFKFEWNPKIIPHILELKEKYITTDLSITSKFKSSFSWTLYDYLKANYGYWHKVVSKSALMNLFGVENVKSYQLNTAAFKQKVLDFAISEINQYTEIEIKYKEIKKGRAIVAFDLYWSTGTTSPSATKNQINELKTVIDLVFEDAFKYVNIDNKKNRERAIQLVRELESYRKYTVEPICITKDFANSLIQMANSKFKELENMVEYDRTAPKVPFYNWLDERG